MPAERYARARICDADSLLRVAAVLAQSGVTIEHCGFDRVANDARPGDFLYFDPPYAPLSATARFTGYTAGGFGGNDQARLKDVLMLLATRGCRVMMSNSTAPGIAELYARDLAVARVGFRCHVVPARRAINANAARRGNVEEYLITNVTEG